MYRDQIILLSIMATKVYSCAPDPLPDLSTANLVGLWPLSSSAKGNQLKGMGVSSENVKP